MLMKTFPFLLALVISPMVHAFAWEVSFKESLPDDPRWIQGKLPLVVTEENGVKVVDFADDSTDAEASLKFPLTAELADEALASGFTIDIRLQHVMEGGNFLVLVRLPGLMPMFFGPYLNEKSGQLSISGFDGVERKTKSAPVGDVGGFVDLKATYRPAVGGAPGTLEIQANGQTILELKAAANEDSTRTSTGLEIGARSPERTGRTLVQSLRFAIP